MTEPIADHSWRNFHPSAIPERLRDVIDPCAYMSCGRPKSEHDRVAKRRGGPTRSAS